MLLLILRHGPAEDHGPDGSDATRRLTAEGIRRTESAVAGIANIVDSIDVILTSPLQRARQTADIAGKRFDCKPKVAADLAYGPAPAVREMLDQRDEAVVMIVGHEPTLSELVELLCTGDPPRGFIHMKKAGCACIEVGDLGLARLLWLATPRMLCCAGGGA